MRKYLGVCFILLIVIVTVVAVGFWKGMHSFVFAWILNFMLMTSVLYITQTYKLQLASRYYNTKKWEDEGKVYRWIGINGFRKILVWVGWEKLNKPSNPVKKNLDALKHLEYTTRKSEFGHLVIFIIVSLLTLFVGFYHGFKHTVWLLILNVLLNIYPIGVQRYNRPRLQKVISNFK